MTNFILGLIGTLLVGLYFGFYLVTLHSLPLGVIFVAVYALAVYDFIDTTRQRKNGNQQ
jgi:uncharacterized membrane protein YeaQ/YmgE (transglycosylase-associated protein family)